MTRSILLRTAAAAGIAACATTSPAAAATFTVTNTNDSGGGSLRQALLDATANPGSNTIEFTIAGSGVKTISPVTDLPSVPFATFIDGFSQPGAAQNSQPVGSNAVHLIVIHGPGGGGDGLRVGTSSVRISGLVINGFTGGYGVHLLNGVGSVLIEGCHIGTDAAGTAAVPNGGGIWAEGTTSFEIGQAFNQPTTLTPEGQRNVISGNNGDGIRISNTAFNTVKMIAGNHIGVDATGLVELGNNGDGVEIFNSATIQLGNTGSVLPGLHDSNLIGGNSVSGIRITGASSTFNGVVAAQIGTDLTGTVNLGNSGAGVVIDGGATDNSLGFGGGGIDGRVRVAFNTGPGVIVNGSTTIRNSVSTSAYGNTGLNIDLGNDGQTANDACDADTGPNALQNKPVITAVVQTPFNPIHVQGTLEASGSNYNIEYYVSSSCNPSNPDAFKFVENAGLSTPGCSTPFDHTLSTFTGDRVQGDDYIVAIARESTPFTQNTSEISNCFVLPPFTSPGVNLNLQKSASSDPATEGVPLVYTLQVANNGQTTANGVTVSDPLPAGTTFLIGDGACTFSNGTQTVTCSYGTIGGNGASVSHQFSVVPTGPGTVTNTATASSSVADDNPADNTDTIATPVSMAVYDFEATTTGGGFTCPPNPKKQICTLHDVIGFLNNGSPYFNGELDLTSTCKKAGTPSVSCKIKGALQVSLFNVLGVANHDITAYLSTDTTVDVGDTPLATAPSTLLALLAPKGKSVKIKYSHPKGTAYTGQYVLLKLDSNDAVGETDEGNNVLVIGVFP